MSLLTSCTKKTQLLKDKRAWVFDLDGTLTIAVHDFAYMRRELGVPEQDDILGFIAAQEPAVKAELTEKLDRLEFHYGQQAQAARGVVELIASLYRQGVCLGVVTRNTKPVALASLEAIGVAQWFDPVDVIGRDEAPHKPDPEGLLSLLSRWQIAPEKAVMVGDYKFDMQVGRAAGCSTVHVTDRPERWPEITDFCVADLEQLTQLATASC